MSLVFTLCSSQAYWPKAQVAIDSIRKYHPEAKIDLRNEETDFPRKRMEQVMYWLEQGEQVIALGADCVLYAPLCSIINYLELVADVVLTPHVVLPPKERVAAIYSTGHANGDCIGFNPTHDAIAAVEWILAQPLAVSEGQFYEQTPLSALPFLMDTVAVLRDPGINCAWYNQNERPISLGENGKFYAGGCPLTMFQFSGYDSAKLSTHWPNPVITPELRKLMTEYEAAVAQHEKPS